jgi:hypothetical protein
MSEQTKTVTTSNSFKISEDDKAWYRQSTIGTYYYVVTKYGEGENMTFDISIYRNEVMGDTSDVKIGSVEEGTLTLTNLNEKEKEYQDHIEKTIKNQLKNTISHLNNSFSDDLTNQNVEQLAETAGVENIAVDGTEESDENEKTPGFWETFDWDLDKLNSNLTNINIEGRQFRDTYKNLYYPEGLGSNRQDRIRFTQKYTAGRKINLTFGSNTKVFQREPEIKIDGSVTLPIVTGIGDRNAVDWKDESLNPIQALAAGAAVSTFENIKKGGLSNAFRDARGAFMEAQGQFKNQKDVGDDMAKAINVYLAQQAVGAQGLLSRATGAILNPNLEMLFGGPKLRSFGFTFKLSPRDASEASQVRQIIRFFKQGMSVKTSSSNVFLKAPNTFDIQYQTYNTDGNLIDHPSINFIKTCALTSCDVQYTPDGTYMTYEDPYRTLTSYQLTLNFSELDPIFDDDYTDLDNNDDQVLGY